MNQTPPGVDEDLHGCDRPGSGDTGHNGDPPTQTTADYLRASTERLRPAMEGLTTVAPGPRTFKTALAVGVAWWLANLLGEPLPVFAALGALVGMQATVVASIRRTGLQLVGILGGVALAIVFSYVTGASALAIGLAVLFGLWVGRLVGSPERIGVELGVTALLVVTFGQGDPGFGAARLWETGLGGLVAAATNALLFPPRYAAHVVEELDTLVEEIARGLVRAVRIYAERPEHEGANETLDDLRAARGTIPSIEEDLKLAEEALRFSPLVRGEEGILKRCREALPLFRRASIHATSIARILRQHADRPHSWPHGALKSPSYLLEAADALARSLRLCQEYVRTGETDALANAERELERAQAAMASFFKVAGQERGATAVERFVDIAAMASDLEHLTFDVAEALKPRLASVRSQ